MKSFKDVWEDAAANSVAGGGVSMPADVLHDKKKKKQEKRVYDGRTKEGRKFVERILARRTAKENKKKLEQAQRNVETIKTKD